MQNLWSIHSRPTELESALKKKKIPKLFVCDLEHWDSISVTELMTFTPASLRSLYPVVVHNLLLKS